jgi:hypothetical protein
MDIEEYRDLHTLLGFSSQEEGDGTAYAIHGERINMYRVLARALR